MSKKGTQLRSLLFESFQEREEPFFYLAPDMIGSVTNANMDMEKNIFVIDFITVDGRNMGLRVKNDCINNWLEQDNGENAGLQDFLKQFIGTSQSEDDSEENEMLGEIVDEYGDIMPDDDLPNNSNNSMIGNSKFGSEKAIKQTIPKSKRYYGDLGLGVITWTLIGFMFQVVTW